ncbi:methyltransferase domain-containing protein [Candidatus Woesearchaeota archaeon]|nr:methyltransferase domain-containing protein [Candidatus Woesearchaeota archaeon]
MLSHKIMKPIKKILISGNKKYYVRDLDRDYHTELGFIRKEDLKNAKPGEKIMSNTGNEFFLFEPFFIDKYKKIKRGAQIISRKDVGFMITEAGLNKDSVVLDAGSGSGALCCYLAKICKKVYSYEIREDFFNKVKKNIDFLQLGNIELKNKDIYQGIDEKELDCIMLDLPEPWKVVDHADSSLKTGGFLISYSPCIPQVMDFVDSLTENFLHLKTVEIKERKWEIRKRKVRPKTRQLGHTGFISFTRKIR